MPTKLQPSTSVQHYYASEYSCNCQACTM